MGVFLSSRRLSEDPAASSSARTKRVHTFFFFFFLGTCSSRASSLTNWFDGDYSKIPGGHRLGSFIIFACRVSKVYLMVPYQSACVRGLLFQLGSSVSMQTCILLFGDASSQKLFLLFLRLALDHTCAAHTPTPTNTHTHRVCLQPTALPAQKCVHKKNDLSGGGVTFSLHTFIIQDKTLFKHLSRTGNQSEHSSSRSCITKIHLRDGQFF